MVWRDKVTVPIDFPLVGLDLTHRQLVSGGAGATAAPDAAAADGATATAAAGDGTAAAAAAVAGCGASADASPATVDPAIYDCVGVVNHYGNLMFGHYTAFANHEVARHPLGGAATAGKWHLFDDDTVRPVKAAEVVSPAAYLLVYKKRKLGAPAAGAAPDAAGAASTTTR